MVPANALACCLIYCSLWKLFLLHNYAEAHAFYFLILGFRFHYNDATAVHQLQNEVCGPPPVEDAHLQGSQYIHWWPVCLCHQDAHDVQNRMSQRWCVFTLQYIYIEKTFNGSNFLGLVLQEKINVLLSYPRQMWCSSSTFISAGSTGLIPTGSTSLAPAEWTRSRTIRQRRMLFLPQLRPSRTNQRGRRKTTKQDLYLPPWSLAAEGKRTREIKAGREVVV